MSEKETKTNRVSLADAAYLLSVLAGALMLVIIVAGAPLIIFALMNQISTDNASGVIDGSLATLLLIGWVLLLVSGLKALIE